MVQALVFLPWAVPTFLIALTWSSLLNPVIGPLPHWWAAMGLLEEPYNILSNPEPRTKPWEQNVEPRTKPTENKTSNLEPEPRTYLAKSSNLRQGSNLGSS